MTYITIPLVRPWATTLKAASWLDRYRLYPVSLTDTHEGPEYTFQSGAISTTVDYIIADASLAPLIIRCWTIEVQHL